MQIIIAQINSNLNKYYMAEARDPENTGFETLLEYIMSLYNKGIRHAIFSSSNFSDLPEQNWGFTIDLSFLSGAASVRAYKHLSVDGYYFRTITVDNNWASSWQKFVYESNIWLNSIKSRTIRLDYNTPSEMYAETDAQEIDNGVPIALVINAMSQTPYESVAVATATKTGGVIRCVALSPIGSTPFVEGHLLSADIKYI